MSELSRDDNPVFDGKQDEPEEADEQEDPDELGLCCCPCSPFWCAESSRSVRAARAYG